MRTNNIVRQIALAGLAVVVTTASIEGVLRLRIPASTVSLFEYTTATPRFKVMKPDVRGVVYGVPFETNNLGFRDASPWSPDKQPDELRVAVLGDSYTVSAGVPFPAIYTQVLQSHLQERLSGWHIRVLNLGVGGYNPVQYLYVLKEVTLGLKPDYIIVGLFPSNDFDNRTYDENKAVALGLKPPPRDEGFRSLYVYKAFGWRVESLLASMASSLMRGPRDRTPAFGPGSDGWEENTSALVSLARTAAAEGLPFLAALLPEASNFQKQLERHRVVMRLCGTLGIECVDMLDEFVRVGIPERELRLNVIDGHPNAEYNRIVGARLGEYVASRWSAVAPVLPRPRPTAAHAGRRGGPPAAGPHGSRVEPVIIHPCEVRGTF